MEEMNKLTEEQDNPMPENATVSEPTPQAASTQMPPPQMQPVYTQPPQGPTPKASIPNLPIIIGGLAAIFVAIAVIVVVLFGGANNGNGGPEDPPVVDNTIAIPDVTEVDEASAKGILSSNGLIPKVEYIYDDDVAKGFVVKTNPEIGTKVEKNTKVTIYVSKGPSYIQAKNSRISWYNISSSRDEWSFYTPYILDGVLYIECKVTFAKAMKWQDDHNKGELFGDASINDTFDKTIVVTAKYQKQQWTAYETQSFTLEIPLADLNVDRPTDLNLELNAYMGSEAIDVKISFAMTWPQ